jgi:hypothetical protein
VTRPLLIAMSVAALAVGVVVAATRGDASYTPKTVVQAFAENGFALHEIPPGGESGSGWTGYAPLPLTAHGRFIFPKPGGRGPFYVFIAQNDEGAREFFAPLAEAADGPGVLFLREGNVVVSSDASLTDTGLTADERRRIEAAMRQLDETG